MDGHITLGELAAKGPSVRGVLLRHRLDFCCKGRTPLEDACRARELDLVPIIEELKASLEAVESDEDWQNQPLPTFRTMRDELGSHLAKEETVLFPAIIAGRAGAALQGPISVSPVNATGVTDPQRDGRSS